MKNHELLDMIGDVSEEYVQGADSNVVRPRFRWKAWAACAACAALVACAYPAYRALNPPLHSYTVMEAGGALATLDDTKAPAGSSTGTPGQGAPDPAPASTSGSGSVYDPNPNTLPGGAYIGGDAGESGIDGAHYSKPGLDAPVQEKAQAQYSGLLQGLGGQWGSEPEAYPSWYGGAWIDNSYYPEAKLAVSIVSGFRTGELEAQIEKWCGGEVVFLDAKYALSHLYALQDSAVDAFTGGTGGLSCGIGVDVAANCLGVDLYSDGGSIPDAVLARLARLDPDGDAIRVRLFTGKLSTLTDEAVKGPAPGAVEDGERETSTPIDGSEPIPGGATHPTREEAEQMKEADQAAAYDLPQADPGIIAEGE